MVIYTDGACKGNPGKGGWGFLAVVGTNIIKERKGGKNKTTNNEMELMAIKKALSYAKSKQNKVTIVTDSIYAVNCLTKWYSGWERNNFITSSKTPVKNKDLLIKIKSLMDEIGDVKFKWVKGHSGNEYNSRADALANLGVQDVT